VLVYANPQQADRTQASRNARGDGTDQERAVLGCHAVLLSTVGVAPRLTLVKK
jgi:hypothetical protein